MSAIIARKNQEKKTEELLKKNIHFSRGEVMNLLSMFSEYANHKEKMDRNKFRDILHHRFKMTDDILMDRVFRAFDTNNDSSIDMDEWIIGLSIFLKGTPEEQTKFCFDVYDMNGDAYITKEEINQLLKDCIVKQSTEDDPDEGIRELCDIAIKTMEFPKKDGDGKLSLKDFRQAVEKDGNLLEVFGPCLPNPKTVEEFYEDFKEKPDKDSPSVYKAAQQKKDNNQIKQVST